MTANMELWELQEQRHLWATHLMVARGVAAEWERSGGLVAESEGAILLERDINEALADRIAIAERELARVNRRIERQRLMEENTNSPSSSP